MKSPRYLKQILKVLISGLALWFVFSRLDITVLWVSIKQANPLYLLAALVFFNVSQIISSFRLLLVLKAELVHLSWKYNLKLYYVGMFYNLILPGGIGGDAYKVVAINRMFQVKSLRLIKALLYDRLNGLLGLCMLIGVFVFVYLRIHPDQGNPGIVLPAMILLLVLAYIGTSIVFKNQGKYFMQVTAYSFIVQAVQAISAWMILLSLGVQESMIIYLILFLVSSIAAALPLSIGGIGLRELVLLWLATEISMDDSAAVALGLLFFVLTFVSSLVAIGIKVKED